ncbi:MAG: LysR family transcriptional regulator [Gammaproteobacteria bacterium]|nr:LysR family transcriptional regulator [Gammaproteobacteria bacterium]
MDIASLNAFITVAECGSFSRASEKLFLTQPAVSKRIASLEAELDTQLFDRIGRSVTLTESGQALFPRAQRILLEVDDSRRAISNLSGEVSGHLSIGTSHHIGLHRLPPILRQFSTEYPQVELDLRFMASEEISRTVRHGDLEIGILTLPQEVPIELNSKPIWHDPLAVVTAPDHPLVKQKKITLDNLLHYSAILPEQGTYTRETIEQAIALQGKKLKIRMSTNYLETIKMMVSIGMGWSILPLTMLDNDLYVLKIKELQISRQLGFIWHRQRTLSNAAKAMMAILN